MYSVFVHLTWLVAWLSCLPCRIWCNIIIITHGGVPLKHNGQALGEPESKQRLTADQTQAEMEALSSLHSGQQKWFPLYLGLVRVTSSLSTVA
jgi:hypothetical protein